MKITGINTIYRDQTNIYNRQNLANSNLSYRGNLSSFDSQENDSYESSDQSYDPLTVYLDSISKYGMVNREEQIELARKIQQGGEEGKKAKQKMINSNLMLVVDRAVKRFEKMHRLDIMDYIQEGNIALAAAVDKYDGRAAFSTFAVPYIDGYIKIAESKKGNFIRVPVYLDRLIGLVLSAQSELETKLRREPTIEEIAQQTNLPISLVKRCKSSKIYVESLHQKIGDDAELMDFTENKNAPSPNKNVEKAERDQYIRALLGNLSEKAQQILILRYGLFDNEAHIEPELAEMFGITKQRVSEIIKNSLKKLHEKAPDLIDYLYS